MKNLKFRIIVAATKSRYKYVAIGFKSSTEALMNAMKMLQGNVPRLLKVGTVK